jgi:lysophospholipase L1-like esterase
MGSSIIYWASRSAIKRPGGKNLNLQLNNLTISWFGTRGMKWEAFDPQFENQLKHYPPPDYLVVHLGSNDLGIVSAIELFDSIKCSLLRCKVLAPNLTIIWSDILPRLYWHNAKDASKIEAVRKNLNRKVKQFLKQEGGLVIRYPSITFAHKDLFRYDGTHLNDLGNSVFLNSLQGGLETFVLSQSDVKVYPDEL